MCIKQQCKDSYERLENLKLVSGEVGIPWQTVYVHLKSIGVRVKGNKLKYGSDSDRFGAKAEQHFANIIPAAIDMNESQFQAKYDFEIAGMTVDVKSARLRRSSKISNAKRWAFSVRRQEMFADFIVAIAYRDNTPAHYFLFPSEAIRHFQTISVAERGGKWWDYEVSKDELIEFFEQTVAEISN